MSLSNLHCPSCDGAPTGCTTCHPTTYNPWQKCTTCGSELHALCGTGDHDTAADLELEALRAERDRYRTALEEIAADGPPPPEGRWSEDIARAALRGGQ